MGNFNKEVQTKVRGNFQKGGRGSFALIYDNEITSLIDIYFLRISFIPSDLFRYLIDVTYSTDK